jgi:hypothetical protein
VKQENQQVPDRAEDGSPTNKSSATAKLWIKPMVRKTSSLRETAIDRTQDDRAYDVGDEVHASALGIDGKLRRIQAKVERCAPNEQTRKWMYKLSSPADQRWYKESEIE